MYIHSLLWVRWLTEARPSACDSGIERLSSRHTVLGSFPSTKERLRKLNKIGVLYAKSLVNLLYYFISSLPIHTSVCHMQA